MNFKIDENLPADVKEIVVGAGHRAETVVEEGLGGTADPSVFLRCQEEGLTILTLDLDFSNIRAYPPGSHHGIVVLRLRTQGARAVTAAVKRFLSFMRELGDIHGSTVIVEEGRIRVRRTTEPQETTP